MIRPLRVVSESGDRISKGEKEVPPLVVSGKDEIASVTTSFNRMRVSLAKALAMLERSKNWLTSGGVSSACRKPETWPGPVLRLNFLRNHSAKIRDRRAALRGPPDHDFGDGTDMTASSRLMRSSTDLSMLDAVTTGFGFSTTRQPAVAGLVRGQKPVRG